MPDTDNDSITVPRAFLLRLKKLRGMRLALRAHEILVDRSLNLVADVLAGTPVQLENDVPPFARVPKPKPRLAPCCRFLKFLGKYDVLREAEKAAKAHHDNPFADNDYSEQDE